jgi:hypothetical protein
MRRHLELHHFCQQGAKAIAKMRSAGLKKYSSLIAYVF